MMSATNNTGGERIRATLTDLLTAIELVTQSEDQSFAVLDWILRHQRISLIGEPRAFAV